MRAGRVFLSQLIHALAELPEQGPARLPSDVFDDIHWWREVILKYSGQSMIWLYEIIDENEKIHSDACMEAGGAYCGKEYLHFRFPEQVIQQVTHINQLELLTITVAIKTWKHKLQGRVVKIQIVELPMWEEIAIHR